MSAAPSPTTPASRWASRPRNILGKISGYLKQAGTDISRVVSASIFVTDLSKKKEMDAVWTEVFADDLPARATVGVADLGGGALIEVVVTALKG
ncbi:enamine deaminase RidA (YjgF/YER057c/UK114 family) [Bradyrhizobium sp. USDA 4473]